MATRPEQPIAPTTAQRQGGEHTEVDPVLEEMRQRFGECETHETDNHRRALDDLRFLNGEGHWTDEAKTARGRSRPMLTINKLAIYHDNTLGDFLQEETSVKVADAQPGGAQYVTDGGARMSEAEVLDGLVRDIESQSAAEDPYEWGADMLLGCGTGSWRIVTEYVDDDTFDLRIGIVGIENPLSVYMDPNCHRADKLDAGYGWIVDHYREDEAKRRWPALTGDFDMQNVGTGWQGWWHDGGRMVAEYFRLVPKKTEIVLLSDQTVVNADKFDPLADELAATGVREEKRRTVDQSVCEWRLVTGKKVLEGPVIFPSKYIPIIQTEGRRLNIAGKRHRRGLITNAKDAARGYSYMRTTEVEVVALQPKAPFIAAAEQIEGYESEWNTAHTANRAVLRYNAIPGMEKPAREAPPQLSSGLAQQSASFDSDMQASSGIFAPALGESEYKDQSGTALRAVQGRTSSTVMPLRSAHARGIRKTGIILADMIPRVYTNARVLRLIKADGEVEWLSVNRTIKDEQTGEVINLNNLSTARAAVSVRTGPAYATRRLEAVNALLAYLKGDPSAAPLARDIIARNLDIPGSQELAARFRRSIPKQILEGEDTGQPPQPTPDQAIAAKKLEAEHAKAEGVIAKAGTDRLRAMVELVRSARDSGVDMMALFAAADAAVELIEEEHNTQQQQPQAQPQDPMGGPGALPPAGMLPP